MKKFWKNDSDDKENELVLGVPEYKNTELNDEFTKKDLIKVCCVIGLVMSYPNPKKQKLLFLLCRVEQKSNSLVS